MGSHYLPHAKVTPLKGFGKSLPSTHKVKGACPICSEWHKEIDQKLKPLTRQMSKFRNINIHVYVHLKHTNEENFKGLAGKEPGLARNAHH